MTKITNDLIYEILKSIQSQVSVLREDMGTVKMRLGSMDTKLGTLHIDIAEQSNRFDRMEIRLEQVERRLNFSDTPRS